MIIDKNIIYFANDWNSDHKVSSHHIANELLRGNRILYVETGGMRPPRKSTRDLKRIILRIISWLKGVRKLQDDLYIYSLIILPFHNKWTLRFNTWINMLVLRKAIKKYQFESPILWFVAPHVPYFAENIENDLVVYYCTDNVAQMPGVNKDALEKTEEKMLKLADVVFATSEHLCDCLEQKKINSNIFYSPHAVNFEHFARVKKGNLTVASELRELKKPIIGYIGLIEKWIDLDLIEYVARAKPDWEFVFVGRVAVSVERLEKIPNIRFLGPQKYEDLPIYLKGFDVCISPFKVNDLTDSVNPIKIKEYLASGKPVVATQMPELKKFGEFVEIADSYEGFVAKIDKVYSENTEEKVTQRMEFVEDDGWANRVEKISEIIENTTSKEPVYATRLKDVIG